MAAYKGYAILGTQEAIEYAVSNVYLLLHPEDHDEHTIFVGNKKVTAVFTEDEETHEKYFKVTVDGSFEKDVLTDKEIIT